MIAEGHLNARPRMEDATRHGRELAAGSAASSFRRALRRSPTDRYQSAGALRADLTHLDRVDARVTSQPDPPMRGLAIGTDALLWRFVAVVAASFIAVVAAITVLTLLLR